MASVCGVNCSVILRAEHVGGTESFMCLDDAPDKAVMCTELVFKPLNDYTGLSSARRAICLGISCSASDSTLRLNARGRHIADILASFAIHVHLVTAKGNGLLGHVDAPEMFVSTSKWPVAQSDIIIIIQSLEQHVTANSKLAVL